MANTKTLSSDFSRKINEPLYGTIKSADIWFLLEYNGVYTKDVWQDSRIPSDVKEKLDAYPNSRPLLIRQPEQVNAHDRVISFFVVHANADIPKIYLFELASYNDLLALDIDAILAGDVVDAHHEPLYIICTNGKRDICCSKYGIALYNAMIKREQHTVWQASHIGGHRFAGTMYCFPHAICYGFLTPDDAIPVIESYSQKRILLDKLRGHAIYDKPIQAAEYFLRRELNNDKLDDVTYLSHESGEGQWTVRFTADDIAYDVEMLTGKPLQVIATTGDDFLKDIPQFKFVSYGIST